MLAFIRYKTLKTTLHHGRLKPTSAAFIPCLKYGIRNYVAVPQGFSASLPYKNKKTLV